MNAELSLFGIRINFASRARRRGLVVLVYFLFAASLTASWLIDQWNFSVIIWVLGAMVPSSWICRQVTKPRPGYLLDERELRWRDRAHFRSYRALLFGVLALWIFAFEQRQAQFSERAIPILASRHPWRPDDLVFGLAAGLLLVGAMLPESMLMWFAPDLPESE